MMEKLYYQDTYQKETLCKVVSTNLTDKNLEVLTDKTIFYPECGGQPGDIGKLGSYDVLDTRKADNGDSILLLSKDADIEVSKEYSLVLNWEHRYRYMIMHACQHMLSGLLFTMFNIGTVSVHLGQEYLTIETNVESISDDVVNKLIVRANQCVNESHKIVYHEMSHKEAEELGLRRSIKVEGDVRIVEIEGVDRIACGGVHVSSTSEIGLILCTGHEQIRGHVRLFFKCGEDSLSFVFNNQSLINSITEKLSCSQSEILTKCDKLISELTLEKSKSSSYAKVLALEEIKKNLCNNIAVFETSLEVQDFIQGLSDFNDLALFVVSDNHWLIVLKGCFEKTDFNTIRQNLLNPINAKGGGRNGVFQGVGDFNKISIKELYDSFKAIVA